MNRWKDECRFFGELFTFSFLFWNFQIETLYFAPEGGWTDVECLGNAFGESKAEAFLDRIMIGEDAKGLDALKWMSSREVVNIVEDEHPQIVAIVVSYLDSTQAAEVIELLPEEIRHEIIMRVARLSDVQQSALAEIENLIASKSEQSNRGTTRKVGGDKVAAEIINALKPERGEQLLEQTEAQVQAGMRQARSELRGVAVDLAIQAAGKLLARNLDDQTQRKLVEDYLADLESSGESSPSPS